MTTLNNIETNKKYLIVKLNVECVKSKRHLEDFGLIPGHEVFLIKKVFGDSIIGAKDSRYAISKKLLDKILVEEILELPVDIS